MEGSFPKVLNPKYTIPPTPPIIHQRLILQKLKEGILISPSGCTDHIKNQNGEVGQPSQTGEGGSQGEFVRGVMVKWGVKGEVRPWEGIVDQEGVQGDEVEIGGVLGVVRLWDNAYLLVYLPSQPRNLFKSQQENGKGYTVCSLKNVYALTIHPDLIEPSLSQLRAVARSLKPKSPRTDKGQGLKWSFHLPNLKPSTKETDELKHMADNTTDTEWDAESDTESEAETERSVSGGMESRESLGHAPEADEDPLPPPNRSKQRFSWNKFLPIKSVKKPLPPGPESVHSEATGVKPIEQSQESLDGSGPPKADLKGQHEKPFPSDPPQRRDLESKIIRQITREFSSGGFFYSNDYDLTHSIQAKKRKLSTRQQTSQALTSLLDSSTPLTSPKLPTNESTPTPKDTILNNDDVIEPDIHLPLWRRTDKRFFWNENLIKEWIDQGLHTFIQPVMQGWIQSEGFMIDGVNVDFTIISRRSKDRAGLRYQRRGIDDQGHVANFVETEMIVRAKVEHKVSVFSFVQIRGSIPLKWSQSPYSMKPPPVLDRPVDQSYSVANLHFTDLVNRYGPVTIINLSEQNGKEGIVTNGYRDLVEKLERDDLTYVPFDFHAKCHGMKWENISELVNELDFGKIGYFWSLSNEPLREQVGAFRTNCIDCLDRTNVVQSALGRHVLSEMLTQLGLVPAASDIENVFNDVWANNGDMLSLCYAHTSALKGDFVRTGKRDIQGMLNDGISSLSRMFYGAISDFFAQAVISFFLGHRNLGVFSEFLASLESTDVSNLAQMSRVRSAAIETSSARVITEHERRLAGWVLLSPEQKGVTLSSKLEEKILLLTNRAIYVVSFNYSLDKVSGFSRIPLGSIVSLQYGAYIISALQEAGRDVKENSGLKITFSTRSEVTRYSTYSLRNDAKQSSTNLDENNSTDEGRAESIGDGDDSAETQFYAFKVLPMEFDDKDDESVFNLSKKRISTERDGGKEESESEEEYEAVTPGLGHALNCQEQAGKIVRKIQRACTKVSSSEESFEVVEQDVVSLSEAEKSTGLFAKMDYAVKRFLWL